MTTSIHVMSYAAPQNGLAFRVTHSVMQLTWLRTFRPSEFGWRAVSSA